jgi:hypothetical protein
MTNYNIDWRTEALRECWDQQMTPQDFAEYVGVCQDHALAILRGRGWPTIPRPEGYVFPFPSYGRRDAKWRAERLQEYVDRRMTVEQFAEHIGMKIITAKYVLRGYAWRSIPRPEGFAYPWPVEGEAA